jgi:hypothetical protein
VVLLGEDRNARKRQTKRAGGRNERGDGAGWAGRDRKRLLSGVDESGKTKACADGDLIDISISIYINQGEGARAATRPVPPAFGAIISAMAPVSGRPKACRTRHESAIADEASRTHAAVARACTKAT